MMFLIGGAAVWFIYQQLMKKEKNYSKRRKKKTAKMRQRKTQTFRKKAKGGHDRWWNEGQVAILQNEYYASLIQNEYTSHEQLEWIGDRHE